jgi:trk system potassium uptake protein
MLVGALPFVLYIQAVNGNPFALGRDSQVRWFLGIVASAVFLITLWLVLVLDVSAGVAVRYAAFNTVSVITGTGYASTDFGLWGAFPVAMLFFLMCVGGCTGSTTGGIKVFRFTVLYATARVQVLRLIQPHGVALATFNRRPLPDAAATAVLAFFTVFGLSFSFLALALSALGLDYLTAMSGALTALANVGPGLGPVIGPAGNFAPLPESAKWLLSFAMLLGRLELFTVLILFAPAFWRT